MVDLNNWYKTEIKHNDQYLEEELKIILEREGFIRLEGLQIQIDKYTSLAERKNTNITIGVGVGFAAIFAMLSAYNILAENSFQYREIFAIISFVIASVIFVFSLYLLKSKSFHTEWNVLDLLLSIKEKTACSLQEQEMKREPFLDIDLFERFQDMLDSTNVFLYEYEEEGDLLYASFDRLKTCINYLNENGNYPMTEEQFITFVMFASMLMDTIKELVFITGNKELYNDQKGKDEYYKYFRDVYNSSVLYSLEKECPTDDKFWEYLRSVVFAHPVNTTHPKFFDDNEKQYSPWVSVSPSLGKIMGIDEMVGVRIYSSTREDDVGIHFSLKLLKDYIVSRYYNLQIVTDWGMNIIRETEDGWRKQVVDDATPIEMFHQMATFLEMRHIAHYDIDEVIKYLSCPLTIDDNQEYVDEYRQSLINILPDLIEAFYSLDYQAFSSLLGGVLYLYPDDLHQGAHYQLEKVFMYLNEDNPGDIVFGLKQAEAFYEEYAKKWIILDVKTMPFQEIRLLIRTALYLGAKNEQTV